MYWVALRERSAFKFHHLDFCALGFSGYQCLCNPFLPRTTLPESISADGYGGLEGWMLGFIYLVVV
jgi:hypothetical protein